MTFKPKEEQSFSERRVGLKNNVAVTQPIARLDDDIVKRKRRGGPKRKYTPTRMKNEINKYFKWCEDEDQLPSIKGMMIFLKMYRDSFYDYLQAPGYQDIMEHARLIISEWAERDVYNTKGMAAGKVAYMKNVHAWSEKIEQNTNMTQTVMTVDQARSKLESLAPKLLEVLKSQNLLNQLALPAVEAEVVEK